MKATWGNTSAEHDDPRMAWAAVYGAMEARWTASVPGVPVPLMADVKAMALAHLAERVADFRAAYVAHIGGQGAAYQTKLMQAREYAALPTAATADPASYPALYGEEAKERALPPAQMAELIIQAERRWATASDQIDAVYLRARTGIDKARAVVDVLAVLRAIPNTL